MNETVNNRSSYRWYILALAALTHALAVGMPTMCMPVLFKEISNDLGLSLVQIGTVWGLASLTGVVTSLLGGVISDRYGARRTLAAACVVAGIAGALRGLSGDFASLAATMFLFGLVSTMMPAVVHKTCGIWFYGPRLGLANGVASTGMALGFVVGSMISATVLSPLLGGWGNVVYLYGGISIVVGALWYFSRPAPDESGQSTGGAGAASLRRAISHVAGLRNVWLVGVVMLGIGGCNQGMLGYLPLYLRDVGWSAASADGAVAAFNGISMVAAIPLALLSDRLGARKPVIAVAMVLMAVGAGLLSVADGAMIWGAVILSGIARDGLMAVMTTMIIEIRGVGGVYAGTAIGLVWIFYRLGGFFSPPLGNSLADINSGVPFAFWAALVVVALGGLYFVRERERSKP
jgi:MFS family permease